MSDLDPFATTPPGDIVPSAFPPGLPSHVGRYRVEKILGEGSFGRVYLAHDEQLGRPVAIKVPHAHRVRKPEDVASYLAEARVLAALDHPAIVPVFDFGTTDDGLCFVVSKLIEGSDLAARLLGTHVRGRAGELGPLAEILLAQGQAEAGDVGLAGLVEQEVRGLDVAVD